MPEAASTLRGVRSQLMWQILAACEGDLARLSNPGEPPARLSDLSAADVPSRAVAPGVKVNRRRRIRALPLGMTGHQRRMAWTGR